MENKKWELVEQQKLPLEIKENMTAERIKEWYRHWEGNVYVSFSGGKDSTVLLHQVRKIYPEVPAVFIDTGLEYPEIVEFVKSTDNVIVKRPEMSFPRVLKEYGYPVISKGLALRIRKVRSNPDNAIARYYLTGIKKNGEMGSPMGKIPNKWMFLLKAPFLISEQCCDIIKKRPIKKYEKESKLKSYVGVMASDSENRKAMYYKYGCNSFDKKQPQSNPLSLWVESDVWDYIKKYNLNYSAIYDKGVDRTGCMFCMFGIHMEKGLNRFEIMKEINPQKYKYCIDKLGIGKVLDFMGYQY